MDKLAPTSFYVYNVLWQYISKEQTQKMYMSYQNLSYSKTMNRITCLSTYGILGLSPEFVCIHYKPSIEGVNLNGVAARNIKRYSQPLDYKWASHREIEKVELYKNTQLLRV